jgi:HEAT repeat protein
VLRKSLQDRSNLIVAEAAKVAAHANVSALIPDLLSALDRLYENAVKADPKCWGKTAIVKALTLLGHGESPVFVRGSRYIQMEPVWGGQEDAAVELRSLCVLALVQCTDLSRIDVLRRLVDAMSDSADPVRLEAVRALEQMDGGEAALLLRLKARTGDGRPAVTGQVFDSLLNLEREAGVPFVAEHLKSASAEVCDEAALALGGSRLPDAVRVLMETWKAHDKTMSREFRGVLLRALSSSRQPSAIEFLLDLVRKGASRDAESALDALKLHDGSPEIRTLVEEAKRKRDGGQ